MKRYCHRCDCLHQQPAPCPRRRQRNGSTRQWRTIRAQVISAHPYCADCGTTQHLQADHIIPLDMGGSDNITNLTVRCRPCNIHKGTVVYNNNPR